VADTERPPPIRVAGPEITSMGWEVYPEGMYRVLVRLRDYGHQHIHVTESGAAFPDEFVDGVVTDEDRLDYHRRYLAQVGRAVADGVPVEGYFAWSLLDNFEWQFGYDMRFGLVRVDFDSQRRTRKDSGRWYAQVAETNRLTTNSP
jgi:beta-glucosidase